MEDSFYASQPQWLSEEGCRRMRVNAEAVQKVSKLIPADCLLSLCRTDLTSVGSSHTQVTISEWSKLYKAFDWLEMITPSSSMASFQHTETFLIHNFSRSLFYRRSLSFAVCPHNRKTIYRVLVYFPGSCVVLPVFPFDEMVRNGIQDLFNVDGMVAIITGGGSGLGLYAARALDANGAKVRSLHHH